MHSKKPICQIPLSQRFYDIADSIRNLQDPLEFNESENVRELKLLSDQAYKQLHQVREANTQFSKNIYKKMISRDNEYTFPIKAPKMFEWDIQTQFNLRGTSKTENQQSTTKRTTKLFKHGDTTKTQQEEIIDTKTEDNTRLTFADINIIDTPEFNIRCEGKEFYNVLKSSRDNHLLTRHMVENNDENGILYEKISELRNQPVDSNQYFSQRSEKCFFNFQREMKFWNRTPQEQKDESKIYSICASIDTFQVSLWNVFEIASRNIYHKDLTTFFEVKQKQLTKMETEKKEEGLQQKYNEYKKILEQRRESESKLKNQRIPTKKVNNSTQIIEYLQQKDFDDYFEQDARNVFDTLDELNKIRDQIIVNEKDQMFEVMATNVSHMISKELFKLLLVMMKGENFIQRNKMLVSSSKKQLEKIILELVYFKSNQFQLTQVNGIYKIQILQRYLQERTNNERFFETYLSKNKKK